jgi:lipopolysaccharide/colanic/teichoic acid biosynthesis glycosyltransferase
VLLAPVFAVAFLAGGLGRLRFPGDRGPLLHRERRISRGREFDLLKLRTLRRDVLVDVEAGRGEARLLERDPSNLTWAARRVLKPWYLDELPQLLNVLRGDMSLVGPRPWPQSMVHEQVVAGLTYRTVIAAGWTGPAQVQKDVVEPADYTELDLDYVRACRTLSPRQLLRYDLGVLRKTVGLIARGEGLRF